ncbi:hypothetical protein Thena_1079 [Thermodesulfobium narugense DSM 14796]|uniref:Outer membrane lipoprotein carrier protein LolA n=1 Tax=Thermodesulfobium narugense DSM 14796 TaxID=747365 RepID=M1E812_9BACT|nr:hypothetical protein [Thermodesulfobium narugense]AEE14705.1 hypothetical protein Thena_1079 [Thermodesulfobium narugense DSM 14796]
MKFLKIFFILFILTIILSSGNSSYADVERVVSVLDSIPPQTFVLQISGYRINGTFQVWATKDKVRVDGPFIIGDGSAVVNVADNQYFFNSHLLHIAYVMSREDLEKYANRTFNYLFFPTEGSQIASFATPDGTDTLSIGPCHVYTFSRENLNFTVWVEDYTSWIRKIYIQSPKGDTTVIITDISVGTEIPSSTFKIPSWTYAINGVPK